MTGKGWKGSILRIHEPQSCADGAYGRLMLTMFSAFAEFERDLMWERQREGIAKAKASGAGTDIAERRLDVVPAFAGAD